MLKIFNKEISDSKCLILICIFALSLFLTILNTLLFAQDDMVKYIETKQKELKAKEDFLAKEEKKLDSIKKDIEEKIEKYSKILAEIDSKLKRLEKIQTEKLDYIVKVYEGMPSEDAAAKLNIIDDDTATEIIRRMKPKKAAAIMASMEPQKVVSITNNIRRLEKKIPAN
ncbi:MAG: hypothetical protein HXY52_02555 [Nitrospirae bacterium]|jgi:flagellar motility protein MotE (MotC chaperone)|nr:hypothetical protein [Nitrospirota bacterium]